MLTKFRLGSFALPAVIFFIYESLLQLFSFKKKYTADNWIDFPTDLRDRVVVVTGANTGIGYQTALKLASFGATVVLACRDISRGTRAADDLNCELSGMKCPYAGKAIFLQLDLCDLVSVVDFSTAFKKKFSHLDILVNNAGANTDGILTNNLSQLFQINYLGHFLLYRCLEDLLCAPCPHSNEPARVVNLSSVMHHAGQQNFKISAFHKYKLYKGAQSRSSYNDSKLYMHFLTSKINNKYRFGQTSSSSSAPSTRQILAVSVNPGAVQSDIWRHVLFRPIFDYLTSFFFLSCQEGCATSVFAAAAPLTCFEEYFKSLNKFNGVKKFSHNRVMRADLPYLVPYNLKGTLARELFGPFSRPEFAPVSLPADSPYLIDHMLFPGNLRGQIPTELSFYLKSREQYWKEKYDETNLLAMKEAAAFHVNYNSLNDLVNSSYDFITFLCIKILDMSGVEKSNLDFLTIEVSS